MKKFEIEVWYRYVSFGEQETDFTIHPIMAVDVQSAVNIANSIYTSLKQIPFKFIHDGKKYQPEGLTKNDLFNLTDPT